MATASGLIYVIATGPNGAGLEDARLLASRLLTRAGVASCTENRHQGAEQRELPGILWGFVPSGRSAASSGDCLSHATSGPREAVLRGDPVWLEPRSGYPCSAAEVLRVWESEGPQTARLIDNISLLLVADRERGEVTLATDRIGGVRLYSALIGPLRVFCTSYLAISKVLEKKPIDGDAIATFFHLGYFPGRRTALRDISVHPAAATTRVLADSVHTEAYWHPDVTVNGARSREESLHETVDAFNTTVREYSAQKDEVYLSITAGLDSRAVASSLLPQRIPFTTYTHGFPGCGEGKRTEKIVKRHGMAHRFVPLTESFSSRLEELARKSFQATEGEISCIEKSHLLHVLPLLKEDAGPGAALLLGGGAGMLKGTFYRLLKDEDPYSMSSVDRYLDWNFMKRLPDIFASEVPALDRRVLREFVSSSLDELKGGSFFQKLDYLYLVRYRRWAGAVKSIYRKFFPVREPFVSHRVLESLFPLAPAIKKAHLPHLKVLAHNFPALQYDLTNTMTPALRLTPRTLPRFPPSAIWRSKQLCRGFSRRHLPVELFPLIDYVNYNQWIREESGQALVGTLLDPKKMKSAFLYDESKLKHWLGKQHEKGYDSFSLIDKMCTLELYFREISTG